MTDKPSPLSTQAVLPSQSPFPATPTVPQVQDEVPQKVEPVEEEPYTIKCICNFSDDDGNTIYCETCDTWQHIDCFYPDNRDEAIREDFAHSCADCKPRPLNRQKAVERTLRLRNTVVGGEPVDKKTKRLPTKTSHKKKPKPNDLHINGAVAQENGKHVSPNETPFANKKPKPSHRHSHSVNSQPSKRSPSYGTSRSNPAHPPSPATTPPDLPEDFQIHHYSAGFCSLYTEQDVPDAHNNAFASLAIPTALARWLREPDTMKNEVGRTHTDVFQEEPPSIEERKPKLEVKDATRSLQPDVKLKWRFVKTISPIEKDVPIIELNGAIGFQKDYCADSDNLWTDLSSPLPFVFFHPILPLYIDTRKEGSRARYVRRSCKPNAQLDTYLSGGSEYHFWLVSDRYISANEQITLPWDFRLEKSVGARWLHLLGLSDDDAAGHDEPEMDHSEYCAISNWIDRILSEYGGCACDLENNCAFARFHRHYLYGKNQARVSQSKKKQRKPRTHTISPTSTGHATNSRAPSEGHADDHDGMSQSESSRSKPPSRDMSPQRQGSFDQLGILTQPTDRDKRKVAMVEDSFRRMEQQQPPKKKKRLSDGTTNSNSSKPKSRHGSVPNGQYVDSGTSRYKSESPSSLRSPNPGFSSKSGASRHESSANRSRQSSASLRPVYCDVAVQTDPIEGEWFSEPGRSPKPRKRIISLSKRLLNSKYRIRTDDQERRDPSLATQTSAVSAMDLDSPTTEQKPVILGAGSDGSTLPSQAEDVPMADTSPASAVVPTLDSLHIAAESTAIKSKTPDLRVQKPPVPGFDSNGIAILGASTPLSTSSSIAQSPYSSNSLSNPFAAPTPNGVAPHSSPVKKKLSLSDYKSRMNKAAGKVVGGSALLKPSPEDSKMEINLESHAMEGNEDGPPSTTASATNGLL